MTTTIKARTFDSEMVVEVHERNIRNSHLFVYEGKIWRWTSKEGHGKNFVMVGEREKSKERVVLKGMTTEMESVRWIIKSTGYITL